MKYIANIWLVMLLLLLGALASPLNLQVYHSASSSIIPFSENKQAVVFSEANNPNIANQIPLFVFDNDEEDDDDTQHYSDVAVLNIHVLFCIPKGNVVLRKKVYLHYITSYGGQKLFLLYKQLKIAC